MVKLLASAAIVSSALFFSCGSMAQAAPSPSGKATVGASGKGYWLSEDLNRLVFWRPPMPSRSIEKSAR